MLRKLKIKLSDDSGAVTVDWVVLTAGVVALNIGVIINYFEVAMIEGSDSICRQTQGSASGSPAATCEDPG